MKKEILITIIFLIFLIFFWNPLNLWMPATVIYMVVGGLFVVVAVYAGLVLRERPLDEREEKHRESAGRIGFLAGVVILSAAIAFQSIFSHPDLWLLGALGAMIISKLLVLHWKRNNE